MKLRLIPIAAVAALMLAGCDKSSTDVSKAVDESAVTLAFVARWTGLEAELGT